MQAIWYVKRLADTHRRKNDYRAALECLCQIIKFFDDFYDDQFDFYNYALRRETLNAYTGYLEPISIISLVKYEDKIWQDKNYLYVVINILDCVFAIEGNGDDVSTSFQKLSISSLKPSMQLTQAIDLASKCQRYHPHSIELYVSSFKVYFRKGLESHMSRCIANIERLNPTHPFLAVAVMLLTGRQAIKPSSSFLAAIYHHQFGISDFSYSKDYDDIPVDYRLRRLYALEVLDAAFIRADNPEIVSEFIKTKLRLW